MAKQISVNLVLAFRNGFQGKSILIIKHRPDGYLHNIIGIAWGLDK